MKFPSERRCMTIVGFECNMLVPWYLMASYAYYHLDMPLISDATYDEICVMLDREWDEIAHVHKFKVDRSHLTAGTCLIPREQYPTLTKAAACANLGIALPPEDFPLMGLSRKIRDLAYEAARLAEAIHAL